MSGYSALSLQDYIRSRHPASLPPSLSHTAYTQQYIKCGMIFIIVTVHTKIFEEQIEKYLLSIKMFVDNKNICCQLKNIFST